MVTCGIDWAHDHHDIAIVDADGRLVAKRRIPESVAGFAELTKMLADAGDHPDDPIPVAIETPRGLLVAVLRASGRPIYPINPMSVARYRERTSMSGKKSDHADAVTLANILRTDADQHRRLPADTELAQSITVLARAHQDATCTTACSASSTTACRPAKPTTRSRHTDRRQRIPHEPPLDLLARSEVCGSRVTWLNGLFEANVYAVLASFMIIAPARVPLLRCRGHEPHEGQAFSDCPKVVIGSID
jgi:Transposase